MSREIENVVESWKHSKMISLCWRLSRVARSEKRALVVVDCSPTEVCVGVSHKTEIKVDTTLRYMDVKLCLQGELELVPRIHEESRCNIAKRSIVPRCFAALTKCAHRVISRRVSNRVHRGLAGSYRKHFVTGVRGSSSTN